MSMEIEQIAIQIENELKPEKTFFSAKDIRKKYPHLPEGYIINVLITLKKMQKIEKWSNKNWRWIK